MPDFDYRVEVKFFDENENLKMAAEFKVQADSANDAIGKVSEQLTAYPAETGLFPSLEAFKYYAL